MIFGSVYCQYSLPIVPFLTRIIDVIRPRNRRPVFLGIDANAKSARWERIPGEGTGRAFEEMLVGEDLTLFSERDKPATFSLNRREF